jgi:actinin alpha
MYDQDLSKKWSEVKLLVPQRDTTLQAELRKQQSNLLMFY